MKTVRNRMILNVFQCFTDIHVSIIKNFYFGRILAAGLDLYIVIHSKAMPVNKLAVDFLLTRAIFKTQKAKSLKICCI